MTSAFYPDGSPALVDQYVRDILNRLTAQVTPKNEVSVYFERTWQFKGHELNPGYDVHPGPLLDLQPACSLEDTLCAPVLTPIR